MKRGIGGRGSSAPLQRSGSRRSDSSDLGSHSSQGGYQLEDAFGGETRPHRQQPPHYERNAARGGGGRATGVNYVASSAARSLQSIFPPHMIAAGQRTTAAPGREHSLTMDEPLAALEASAQKVQQRSSQRRLLRDLRVRDSESDSSSSSPDAARPRGTHRTTEAAGEPPTPPRRPADSPSSGRSSAANATVGLPASGLPVLRSPLHQPLPAAPPSPIPKPNAEELPPRKAASSDSLTEHSHVAPRYDDPAANGVGSLAFMPPPPAHGPPRTAQHGGKSNRRPATPSSRGPGSSRTTPVADDRQTSVTAGDSPRYEAVHYQQHRSPPHASPTRAGGCTADEPLDMTTPNPRGRVPAANGANRQQGSGVGGHVVTSGASGQSRHAVVWSDSAAAAAAHPTRESHAALPKPQPKRASPPRHIPSSNAAHSPERTRAGSKKQPGATAAGTSDGAGAHRSKGTGVSQPHGAGARTSTGAKRANSAEVLSQTGVFSTAALQSYGPCGCAAHDAGESYLHEDWIRRFLDFSKGLSSVSRMFDLNMVPLASPHASAPTGGAAACDSHPAKKKTIGVWCSVDSMSKRRADMLPPKRFLAICGERGPVNDATAPPNAVELVLFPHEPLDAHSGIVRSVPCASFPVTPRRVAMTGASTHSAAAAAAAGTGTERDDDLSTAGFTFTRVRLTNRKFHFLIEVFCCPIAPLIAECSPRMRRTSSFAQAFADDGTVTSNLDSLLRALDDSGNEALPPQCSLISGATIGLFDSAQFLDVLGTLLDLTSGSRTWLLNALRSAAQSKLGFPCALHATLSSLRSPLAALEFRTPLSLWRHVVKSVEEIYQKDPKQRAALSHLSLADLQFQESIGNAGLLTFDAFGTVKSASHAKLHTVYDVRCLPHHKTKLYRPSIVTGAATDDTADSDAALVLEYVSRMPYLQRVHAILSDASRYFVVLPPLLSKQFAPAVCENRGDSNAEYLVLHDLCLAAHQRAMSLDQLLDFVRKTTAQLVLAVGLLHSRGVVVGALTPRRILCKLRRHGTSFTTVETSVTGVGVSSVAFSWLRQQRGLLEYLSPAFFSQFMTVTSVGNAAASEESKREVPHPSVGAADDWWALGCIMFELFSGGTHLFPVPPGGDKSRHIRQWAELLLPGGLNIDSAISKDLLDYSSAHIAEHIAFCVEKVVDQRRQRGEDRAAPLHAPNAADSHPTQRHSRGGASSRASQESNLAARKFDHPRGSTGPGGGGGGFAFAAGNHSRVTPSPRRSIEDDDGLVVAQQARAVAELVDVLKVLLDLRNFDGPRVSASPCPSGFHGFVVQVASMPFFRDVDWVDLFQQTEESQALRCNPTAPIPPTTRSRSASSESRRSVSAGPSPKPRSASPASHRDPTSGRALDGHHAADHGSATKGGAAAGATTTAAAAAQPTLFGSSTNANPLAAYSTADAAALIDILKQSGGYHERRLALEAERNDHRLQTWSAAGIQPLTKPTSFLRPTSSFMMYRKAVEARLKHVKAVGGHDGHESDRDSGARDVRPQRADRSSAPAANSSSIPQPSISALDHSYSFQRPKSFIDVHVDRVAGSVYNPPPVDHQGDISAFTKSILSSASRHTVLHRKEGYLEALPPRGKGTYTRPEEPLKEFGEPPPLPQRSGGDVSGAAGVVNVSHSTAQKKPQATAIAEMTSLSPLPHVSPVLPVPEVATPKSTQRRVGANTEPTISPATPSVSSVDPTTALFKSPPAVQPLSTQRNPSPRTAPINSSNNNSRETPDQATRPKSASTLQTPTSRPAMQLPPRSADSGESSSLRSPVVNSESKLHDRRMRPSDGAVADDSAASTADSPTQTQRYAAPSSLAVRHNRLHDRASLNAGEPVSLPTSVTSVRSATTAVAASSESESGDVKSTTTGTVPSEAGRKQLPPKSPTAGSSSSHLSHAGHRQGAPQVTSGGNLGRWEKVDHTAEQSPSPPSKKKGALKRRSSQPAAPAAVATVAAATPVVLLPPPPPPKNQGLDFDDEDDDRLFS